MDKKEIMILSILLVLFFCNVSYALGEKSILILVDELDLELAKTIGGNTSYGIGYINLRTKKIMGDESYYFSIALGEKTKVRSEGDMDLYEDEKGSIIVSGLQDAYKVIRGKGKKTLGERLKNEGIAYIGNGPSAIIAADNQGQIESGEIEVIYNMNWLMDRTDLHLARSNLLVLSFDIDNSSHRIALLEEYIRRYKDYSITIMPERVPQNMIRIINTNLAPIIYIKGGKNGIIESPSTKRKGFITLEDIYADLLWNQGQGDTFTVGNRVRIIREDYNFGYISQLFKESNNLMWIVYFSHGLVYFIQAYTAYFIYKDRKDKFDRIRLLNSFMIINIFIGLLMGIFALHRNLALYLTINLIITYIITTFMGYRNINTIGLFTVLTYITIVLGIFFYPKMIYYSFIGFNNLFYGVRFYGLNNGIAGVLLASSIIGSTYIGNLVKREPIKSLMCVTFALINLIALSAAYGANTGGFIAAIVLFLFTLYIIIIKKGWRNNSIVLLILVGIAIFAINMYCDYFDYEKGHAIRLIMRFRNYGFMELSDMFKVKARELFRLTIMPPFSMVIIAQAISLKRLLRGGSAKLKTISYLVITIGILAYLLNDTGIIAIIYMVFYLLTFIIHHKNKSAFID